MYVVRMVGELISNSEKTASWKYLTNDETCECFMFYKHYSVAFIKKIYIFVIPPAPTIFVVTYACNMGVPLSP